MCLIAWNWNPEKRELLLLSNRDEFYARPTLPAHWWPGNQILAGKDLQAGGTWLGLARNGRMAALTNFRAPDADASGRPSRGELVAGFLQSDMAPEAYLRWVQSNSDKYLPFNLLIYDGRRLLGLESRHQRIVKLEAGIGAVSNADFNTPWPKLTALKQGLEDQKNQPASDLPAYLPLLMQRKTAPVESLPDTGVGQSLELTLSAIFVASPAYGTRACSVLKMSASQVDFMQQSFDAGELGSRHSFSFEVPDIV